LDDYQLIKIVLCFVVSTIVVGAAYGLLRFLPAPAGTGSGEQCAVAANDHAAAGTWYPTVSAIFMGALLLAVLWL